MQFINSWKSKNKQGGKISVKCRWGKITFFDFYYDKSRNSMGIILFNFGIKKGKGDAVSV